MFALAAISPIPRQMLFLLLVVIADLQRIIAVALSVPMDVWVLLNLIYFLDDCPASTSRL